MDIKGNKVLVVEDEESLRGLLKKILGLEGLKVFEAGDLDAAWEIINRENIYAIVTDVKLPDGNGIDFTQEIKRKYPLTEVIVLTAYSNVKDGVKAMKLGAFDYITKGDGDEKLPLVVTKAVEKALLNQQVQDMEQRLEARNSFSKILGQSKEVQKVIDLAKKVAVTDTTVLILGETGTGKELVAEAIHHASPRRKGPFVPINCAAIPKDLQESELFGHKKGAFTGANFDKKGYLETAAKGTVFLDELGEMSQDLQAKMLRALENKTINKVGDPTPIPIDVRIVAATNKKLLPGENEDQENGFRKDLYYRLSTFSIELPPLKERVADIDLLTMQFVASCSEKLNKKVNGVDDDFMWYLKNYHWPGNIRELKNVIERAVILTEDDRLTPENLPEEILQLNQGENSEPALQQESSMNTETDEYNGATQVQEEGESSHESLNEEDEQEDLKSIEKDHIEKVLKKENGNKQAAAKKLNIGLATLYRKLKEYKIDT